MVTIPSVEVVKGKKCSQMLCDLMLDYSEPGKSIDVEISKALSASVVVVRFASSTQFMRIQSDAFFTNFTRTKSWLGGIKECVCVFVYACTYVHVCIHCMSICLQCVLFFACSRKT